jgi:hypothetical protein
MPRPLRTLAPPLLALALTPACGDSADDDATAASTTLPDPATTTAPDSTTDTPTTGTPDDTTATTGPELPPCSAELTEFHLPGAGPTITRTFTIAPGHACLTPLYISAPVPRIVEIKTTAGSLRVGVEDRPEDEPGWQRPRELTVSIHPVFVDNPGPDPLTATLEILDHGPSPGPLVRDRSLVWTHPAIVETPPACRLACLLSNISADAHGGQLLRQWFDRFSTTAHSERLGPKNLLEDHVTQTGLADPTTWDLDALPFTVTAVHNRLDLRTTAHCGELRVSLASTHPIFRPFHLIFLFAQPPVPADISPGGALHCAATALRWARLADLPEPEFIAAAHALVAEHVTLANFLAAESNEFMIAPWEWRQWFFTDPLALDNRPLFQTVDIPRLNAPGPDRDAFLAWAEANAADLSARRLAIPEEFRSPSARANQGTPWVPLILPPALDAAWPDLRRNLEIVGCPACHATDAEFVQTLPDRTFSPFYAKELDARAVYFHGLFDGTAGPPPFGPLQPTPLLPP